MDIYSFSRSQFSPLKQKLGKKLFKIVFNILKVLLMLGVCPASCPEVFHLTSKVTCYIFAGLLHLAASDPVWQWGGEV